MAKRPVTSSWTDAVARMGVRYACGPVFGDPEPLYNSVVAL